MQPNLLTIDSEFTNHYKELLNIQSRIKAHIENYSFDLSKTEITDAIIARMDAFWYFNVNNNKKILNRSINTTSADFLSESCLLFFKSYFSKANGFEVCSERNIRTDANIKAVIRPDITIWKNEKLLASIELKVSDGWKGKTMMEHLIQREQQIIEMHPDSFFGVIAYWNFFNKAMVGWGTKYIGIKQWNESANHPKTGASIESLIKEIEAKI